MNYGNMILAFCCDFNKIHVNMCYVVAGWSAGLGLLANSYSYIRVYYNNMMHIFVIQYVMIISVSYHIVPYHIMSYLGITFQIVS